MDNEKRSLFEKKIKPTLEYIGTIGSVLMAMAYIVVIFVLIYGLKAQSFIQTLTFSIVSAIVGLGIMQLLKIQGITFAQSIPENKLILDEYYNTQTQDKKARSLKYFWVSSLIKDIIIKGLTLMISTAGIIYIVIQGSEDYILLLLGVINLILFACFGLLSLTRAYDFVNNSHIPYIKQQIEKVKQIKVEHEEQQKREREEAFEAEVQKRLEMAKKELTEQRDTDLYNNRRVDILEPINNVGNNGTDQTSILGSVHSIHGVLGMSIDTSDTNSISDNLLVEESVQQIENEKEQGDQTK